MHASVREQPPMTSSSCNLSDKFLSLLFLPDRANDQRNVKEKKAEWIVKETAKHRISNAVRYEERISPAIIF